MSIRLSVILIKKIYILLPSNVRTVNSLSAVVFQTIVLCFTKGLRDLGVQPACQEKKEKICTSFGFGPTRNLSKRYFTITTLCQKRLSLNERYNVVLWNSKVNFIKKIYVYVWRETKNKKWKNNTKTTSGHVFNEHVRTCLTVSTAKTRDRPHTCTGIDRLRMS